jgi:hypothetical protein
MTNFLCMKCRGAGTRAHHRRCQKRGDGHRGRRGQVEYLEAIGYSWGLDLGVRRGRRGDGISISRARGMLRRNISWLPSAGSEAKIRAMAAEHLGCDATVETPEPGHVVVRPVVQRPEAVLHAAWRKMVDHIPSHMALTVEQAHV